MFKLVKVKFKIKGNWRPARIVLRRDKNQNYFLKIAIQFESHILLMEHK